MAVYFIIVISQMSLFSVPYVAVWPVKLVFRCALDTVKP